MNWYSYIMRRATEVHYKQYRFRSFDSCLVLGWSECASETSPISCGHKDALLLKKETEAAVVSGVANHRMVKNYISALNQAMNFSAPPLR